jgi:regulator-associated protein of mTOR
MRGADDLPLRRGHAHPNPLASHATQSAHVNGMATDALPVQHAQHPPSSSRPGSSGHASSTHVDTDDRASAGFSASNGALAARPGLLRARSDVGPRPSAAPPESADGGSVDGHFKIRHGWDDQLNSEEYSNLLTSVCAACDC